MEPYIHAIHGPYGGGRALNGVVVVTKEHSVHMCVDVVSRGLIRRRTKTWRKESNVQRRHIRSLVSPRCCFGKWLELLAVFCLINWITLLQFHTLHSSRVDEVGCRGLFWFVQLLYLSGESEEKYESFRQHSESPRRDSNPVPHRYESGVPTTTPLKWVVSAICLL
jgi:hypothetical protein